MIRGYLAGAAGRRRPFVDAHLVFPTLGLAGRVPLLIDTGADTTLLAPTNALRLGIPLTQLPPGPLSAGVGGTMPTVLAPAAITLGGLNFPLTLPILAPATTSQAQVLSTIPSLLGRDILAYFALFFEQRTQRVLLLEPHEADSLPLP